MVGFVGAFFCQCCHCCRIFSPCVMLAFFFVRQIFHRFLVGIYSSFTKTSISIPYYLFIRVSFQIRSSHSNWAFAWFSVFHNVLILCFCFCSMYATLCGSHLCVSACVFIVVVVTAAIAIVAYWFIDNCSIFKWFPKILQKR